jgi:hypothetical protein
MGHLKSFPIHLGLSNKKKGAALPRPLTPSVQAGTVALQLIVERRLRIVGFPLSPKTT